MGQNGGECEEEDEACNATLPTSPRYNPGPQLTEQREEWEEGMPPESRMAIREKVPVFRHLVKILRNWARKQPNMPMSRRRLVHISPRTCCPRSRGAAPCSSRDPRLLHWLQACGGLWVLGGL